jgi:hypothetical protein
LLIFTFCDALRVVAHFDIRLRLRLLHELAFFSPQTNLRHEKNRPSILQEFKPDGCSCARYRREAFTSDAELTKTLLHETLRLVKSQSASGVSGEVATSEATVGKVLIGVLIGAAVVGGIAAIVLSGGTAAPAIIVGLEAAGDVAVGTELVDVIIRTTP